MRVPALLLAAVLSLGLAGPAGAGSEQDRARAAVRAGELRPLQDILPQIRRSLGGRVLDARIDERGKGRWVYRIKMLMPDGRVVALTVDGRTGDVLQVR